MTTERAKTIIQRHIEEMWNGGELGGAAEICADSLVQHDPFTTSLTTLDSYLAYLKDIRHAFPDLSLTVHDMVAEGSKVVVRWTFEGTHTNAIRGIAPTGRRVVFAGMSLYILQQARIAEIWTSWDTIGYLRQLDAVPGLEGAAARG